MTSRDFRAIAAIIAGTGDRGLSEGAYDRESLAALFADYLATTSPRFERFRFMAAARGAPLTQGDKPRVRDFAS